MCLLEKTAEETDEATCDMRQKCCKKKKMLRPQKVSWDHDESLKLSTMLRNLAAEPGRAGGFADAGGFGE